MASILNIVDLCPTSCCWGKLHIQIREGLTRLVGKMFLTSYGCTAFELNPLDPTRSKGAHCLTSSERSE